MKKITFIAILLLCICSLTKAKEKVIEQPPFIALTSTSIQVDKVVLSDTATVLYIKAFYHPKQWIRISGQSFLKDNNGETYALRSGIGIKPDTEFWMPESGEGEFRPYSHRSRPRLLRSIFQKETTFKVLSRYGAFS